MDNVIKIGVQVTGAKEATAEIRGLSAAFSQLQKVMGKTSAAGLNATTNSANKATTAIKKATTASKAMSKATTSAGEAASKASGGIGKFVSSLGRIAYYRLIRSIIKAITSAFSEGTQNLYQWSKSDVGNGTFASAMDSIASSTAYLKNSMGALAGSLLTSLAPVIGTVIDWFVDLLNTINQVIAALSGKSTYTKAKKYLTEWKDTADDANDSATKLKATLLGIDEINRLDDNSSSTSGTSSAEDYSEMFEETVLDEDLWKKVLKWVGLIGAGIAAWKLAPTLLSGLSSLSGVAGTLATAATVALSITGFTIEAASAYSIGYDGANLTNIIGTVLGGALGIGGGAVAGGMIAGVGAATTLMFTIPLALTIAVAAIYMGQYDAYIQAWKESDETFQAMEEIVTRCNTALEANATNVGKVKDAITKAETKFEEITDAEVLLKYIKELNGKTNLTVGETNALKSMVETLNAKNIDGLNLSFDTATGHLAESNDEIDEMIQNVQRLALKEASVDIMTEAYKGMYQAMYDSEQAQEDYNEASETYNSILAYINDNMDELVGDSQAGGTKLTLLSMQLEKAKEAMDGAQEVMDTSAESIATYTQQIDLANTALENIDNITIDTTTFTAAYGTIGEAADTAKSKIEGMLQTATTKTTIDAEGNITVQQRGGRAMYASGGIVDSGSVFVANENGAPEMVGNFGSHTAVANTSQIVEGISIGVSNANSEQNALLREQNSLLTQMLRKNATVDISTIMGGLNRANRIAGKTVVPMGL